MSTPPPIAELMVALAAPRPSDVICDPAAGDCALLAAAAERVRADFPAVARDPQELAFFRERMFHAFGADPAGSGRERLRALGVDGERLAAAQPLGPDCDPHAGRFSLIVSQLPFSGSREPAGVSKELLRTVRSKRLELLYLARALGMLGAGGRAVVLVPDHLLSGATKAHRQLRAQLVEGHEVRAVIALPRAALAPQAGPRASILVFTRTDRGGTGQVWFCALAALATGAQAGGAAGDADDSADRARRERPREHVEALARWRSLDAAAAPSPECARERDAASFCVPKAEIAAQGYDLGCERYRLPAPAQVETRRPQEILAELAGLEAEIFQGMKDLVGMLK